MSKHTPGPWTAHPPTGGDPDADGSKYHWTVRAPGGDSCLSFQLCEISSMNRREDGHDARLIAAAPELLDALQDAIAIFPIDSAPKWLARARAAIEKAGAA